MKKILVVILLALPAVMAQAQFEKGKFIVNPALTGLGFSYSGAEKGHFGLQAEVGAFLVDNVALLVHLGGDWKKGTDVYSAGVGGRYFFDKTGVYAGGNVKMQRYVYSGDAKSKGNISLGAEVGYAFFISQYITLEPAVYYDQSLNHHSDFSKFGIKAGFGFYF